MPQWLREQDALVSLLESIGDAIVIVDATGRLVRWNAAAEKILGRDAVVNEPAEWVSRMPVARVTGEPLLVADRSLSRALRGENVDGVEFVFAPEGAEPQLLSASTRPFRDHDGRIVGAVSVFREVTAARRAEAALARSERLYRAIARHLPSSIVLLFDRDLVLSLAEGGALEKTPLRSADLEAKRVGAVLSDELIAGCEAALRGEITVGYLERFGRYYRVEIVPVRDDLTSETVGGLVVAHDLTEDHAAAEALRQVEEMFRLTFDQAPIGMAIVSPEGRWVRVNNALCEMVGYTREELLGRGFQEITHPDDLAAGVALVGRLVRGEITEHELAKRYVRKDGSVAEILLYVSLLRDDAGRPRHFVTQMQDVTEKRRLQEQVMTADRMVSLGTLAAGVAHEMNNPLAYVLLNAEHLAEQLEELGGGAPSGRLRDLLGLVGEIRSGAERLRKIVRGLKSFARADEEVRIPLDLRRVADVAVNMAMNEIRHRARLVKDYRDAPLVLADEGRMTQVLLNLLVNAAQAIDEGAAQDNEVRVTVRPDDEGWAVVEVSDTGSGIDPAIRRRIFDPFFTTKPIGQGTGLGLSISHGLVRSAGGELRAENDVGGGSTFIVRLPPAPDQAPDPIRSIAPADPAPRPIARPYRVLVVDDDAMVGRALQRALDKECRVELVESGHAALARLGQDRYDAIVSDLMMAAMTGMELYDQVARRWPEMAARIVFVTGGAFTASAQAFLGRLTNPWLEKPVNTARLNQIIRSLAANNV